MKIVSITSLRRSAIAAATVLALGGSLVAHAVQTSDVSLHRVAAATSLRNVAMTKALPATAKMHIVVALKLRNRDQLQNFIDTANTSLVVTRRTLSSEQVASQFMPTPEQANRVAEFLTKAGFNNVTISENRMLVSADGGSDLVSTTFRTSMAQVQTIDGKSAYANTTEAFIPAELSDVVLSVIGLQNLHQRHTMNVQAINAVTGHNPTEFSSIYGATGVPTGAGITVGIITQGSLTATISDLNRFTSNNGLATVTTQTVNTNGTSSDTSGTGEWNLDSQDVVGMAGGQVGKIIFYNIPSLSNADLTADINTVVTANATKIINVSLGECENDAHGDGSQAADDQLFQTAVAQGQTFSVSTGDSGADECGDGGTTPSDPASSPYVVAVGGTTLNASTTTWSGETVWSGGGGSISKYEARPSWQAGVNSSSFRSLPDISFDADPNSGAKVIVNGGTQQIGGTSLSAPIFAGAWARILSAHPGIGFAAPLFYNKLTSVDYHDVTSGNNGGETAQPGYDLATGFGSLILSNVNAHIASSGSNVPPTANFSVVTSGLTATFTDTSTDSDGSIASRSWNFGDGSTSTTANPSHTYAAAGSYTVSLQVTDNGGATNTKSSTVTVSSTGGGNVLQNGVAVTGLSAATGGDLNYTMVVPAGATNLSFAMSGGTGDADLYVKFGAAPTSTVYDCRPYLNGNAETCSFATPSAGTYYVRVHAYAAFSGVTLKGSYTTGSTGGTTFSNNTPKSIPDLSTVTSTIAVSGLSGSAPSTLKCSVNITHTYRGDLKIDLLAPNGTVFPLKAASGSDSAANVVTTYTVNASTITAPNGTWTLRIQDTASGDTGTLNNWSLQF